MACSLNENLEIIKYLVENYNMDIKFKNNNDQDCLELACIKNINVKIINYISEKLKPSQNNHNVVMECFGPVNIDIIRHLINNHMIDDEIHRQ